MYKYTWWIISEQMTKFYALMKIMQERLLTDAEVKWIKELLKKKGGQISEGNAGRESADVCTNE